MVFIHPCKVGIVFDIWMLMDGENNVSNPMKKKMDDLGVPLFLEKHPNIDLTHNNLQDPTWFKVSSAKRSASCARTSVLTNIPRSYGCHGDVCYSKF